MGPIDKALNDLESQEAPNIKATAEKWKVNRTTLLKHFNGKAQPRHKADQLYKCKLLLLQEKVLINYINKLSVRGIPPIV